MDTCPVKLAELLTCTHPFVQHLKCSVVVLFSLWHLFRLRMRNGVFLVLKPVLCVENIAA